MRLPDLSPAPAAPAVTSPPRTVRRATDRGPRPGAPPDERPRSIVVGAGIGGLATAARLAHQGWRVTVLEQHEGPGGRAGVWESAGFRFDTGPSLVLMVEYWEQLFRDLGRRFEDYVRLVQLDPNYRISWADGSTLEVTSNLSRLLQNVERLSPGSGPGMLRFLAHSGRMYQRGLRYIDRPMHSLAAMADPRHLGGLFREGAIGGLQSMVGRYFTDQRLRQAMTFQSLYLGLSPYESMGIYSLLAYTEIGGGLYYPQGGIHQLALALERLCREEGVEFRYRTRVTGLEREADRVTAVRLQDGGRLPADAVVMNADLPWVYKGLLGEPQPRFERMDYSCSAVLMYLGVNRRYPGLLHHNLVVSADMPGACREIFEHHRMPDDPPFYVCVPSRTDPTVAPDGCEAIFVLVLAPSQDPARPVDWGLEGPKVEARMLERLEAWGLPGLRDHLVTSRLFTPAEFGTLFNNTRGEAFGLSHGFTQIGAFRPRNRHDRCENLYFVGQSTHPGCGLPMVLISARLLAERMAAERPAR